MTEKYPVKPAEIVTRWMIIAKENDLPINKVKEIYSKFNTFIYKIDPAKDGGFKLCKPELENIIFQLTEGYINLKKISKLKEYQKN